MSTKRVYLKQTDVPSMPISDALKVAYALRDNFGYKPTSPGLVAAALRMLPASSSFRMLTSASIAYGITEGAAKASLISLTKLGDRIVKPTKADDDIEAQKAAFLRPRLIREFLERYDMNQLPREDIGKNILVEMGVPSDKTDKVWDLIISGGNSLGLIEEFNGRFIVQLTKPESVTKQEITPIVDKPDSISMEDTEGSDTKVESDAPFKILILHNNESSQAIKQLEVILELAEIEFEIMVNRIESAPMKGAVYSALKRYDAAIIFMDVVSANQASKPCVSENSLLKIGAALMHYDQRVILVWDKKHHPSVSLRQVLRCRFDDNGLSRTEGLRLMRALMEFRTSLRAKKNTNC